MRRDYYSDTISGFINTSRDEIPAKLVQSNDLPFEQTQRDAWLEEIRILKDILQSYDGAIYFEYSIPRMGKRIDAVLIIGATIFVLEFKVGEKEYPAYAIEQVWDYALDLKTSMKQAILTLLDRWNRIKKTRKTNLSQERPSCSANSCQAGYGYRNSAG